MQGILFDLDGVFYVGDRAIAGASDTLAWVRDAGIPHLFLTNTTSRPRSALAEKLATFGIDTDPEHILTPPVAASEWLRAHIDGPLALFVPDATQGEFDAFPHIARDAPGRAAAVVIGDLGEAWDYATLNAAFRHLHAAPAAVLIALGMTRYWRAPDGLRLDVGPMIEALRYASGVPPVVMGKPAPAFFAAARARLNLAAADTIMIGDDIRGDIGGAQAAGLRGIQVRTGKFRAEDLNGAIRPDAVLDSIADLPRWWRAHVPVNPPAE